jgi:hypothetical protein
MWILNRGIFVLPVAGSLFLVWIGEIMSLLNPYPMKYKIYFAVSGHVSTDSPVSYSINK